MKENVFHFLETLLAKKTKRLVVKKEEILTELLFTNNNFKLKKETK
jgi:hypothetical protein